jgi:hypothetical protein
MKKQIAITLFGAAGTRTLEITPRGGFPIRHVQSPRETVPSIFAPVNPKSAEVPPPSLLEVMRWMHISESHTSWFIIDEILFIATTQYKMGFNHNTLLDALRELYQQGCLAYRLNRFDQHTFQLIGENK